MMSRRIPSALTATEIPCCLCGTMILPNGANQCSSCLAQEFDLKGHLQKGNPSTGGELIVYQCRQCRRFQQAQQQHSNQQHLQTKHVSYRGMEWESPELLSLCLKSIPALSDHHHHSHDHAKIQLLDVMWVWTEPHSRRIKLRLTVKTDIHNVTIQQRVIVEFKMQWLQCSDCKREYTNRTWHALVQVRQKRDHASSSSSSAEASAATPGIMQAKKGLSKLENAIFQNPKIRKHVLKIDTTKNGFDFYFLQYNQAMAFTNFLLKVAPMKTTSITSKLISTDSKNNTANMKHTLTCDIVPLVKDDLICVPRTIHASKKSVKGVNKLAATMAGKLALVTKVSSVIHLLDISPKRNVTNLQHSAMAELTPDTYFKMDKNDIPLLLSSNRLIRFVVLDVELCQPSDQQQQQQQYSEAQQQQQDEHHPHHHTNYALADVQVARESDFGQNDEIFTCVTHLGNILQPGDIALGYDLVSSVLSEELESGNILQSNYVLPDIILVKKVKQKQPKTKKQSNKKQNGKTIDNDENEDGDVIAEGGEEEERDTKHSKQKKKRETRLRRKRLKRRQQKRGVELRESAARMGFLDDDAPIVEEEDDADDDDEEEDLLLDNPDLKADLEALEKDLQCLTVQEEEESKNDNNNKNGVVGDKSEKDTTVMTSKDEEKIDNDENGDKNTDNDEKR